MQNQYKLKDEIIRKIQSTDPISLLKISLILEGFSDEEIEHHLKIVLKSTNKANTTIQEYLKNILPDYFKS